MSLHLLECPPRVRLGLVAVVLCALLATQLTLGAYETLWLDELTSYWFSKADSLAGVFERMVARRDPHPPLFQALLYGWLAVPGVDGSVLGPRLSSIAASLAAVGVTALFAERLARPEPAETPEARDRGTALLVVVCLFAGSRLALYYGVELRSYELQIALAAVVLSCRERARLPASASPGAFASFAWVASSVALSLTHYFGALFVGCLFLTDVVDFLQRRTRRRAAALSLATLLGPALSAAWLAYQAAAGGLGRQLSAPGWKVFGYFHELFGPLPHLAVFLLAAFTLWLTLRGKGGGVETPRKSPGELLFTASRTGASSTVLAIALAMLVSMVRPILQPANFAVFVPSVLSFVAILTTLAAQRSAPFRRAVPLALGLSLLGGAFEVTSDLETPARRGEDTWLLVQGARGPLVIHSRDMAQKARDASQLASTGRERLRMPEILVLHGAESPALRVEPESLPRRFTLACGHCKASTRAALEQLARAGGARCKRVLSAPSDWAARCTRRAPAEK